jgi:flavin reductase (DIM6/NTAB) family NADH-FMN oxidoreductase RutF
MIKDFRKALTKLVYPVAIVSGLDSANNNYAITVSSLTSVSFEPPSILVCINKESSFSSAVKINNFININLLNNSQKEISTICSNPAKKVERFDNQFWSYDENNVPYLKSSQSVLFSNIESYILFGTHYIVVMKIFKTLNFSNSFKPLLYGNQKYIDISKLD